MNKKFIVNDNKIEKLLREAHNPSTSELLEIFDKALELKGLDEKDIATLMQIEKQEDLEALYQTAKKAKIDIYGKRLVLFAPLYTSNLCKNECKYCAYKASNKELKRIKLSPDELKEDVKSLLNQGHKRLLLVAGEYYGKEGLQYIYDSIDAVYSVQVGKQNIRRLNINIAPIEVEDFKILKKYDIGTYQLFQETYHKETYKYWHTSGQKADYEYRLDVMDRAFQGGLDDLGIGVLYGLYDWKYDTLAMFQHIKHLESIYGVGPHTISVPRIEPGFNLEEVKNLKYAISDDDFKKLIAILRLSVPYTGIILSTRENAQIRRDAFELGISQMSAGSKTNPGGYKEEEEGESSQFYLGDHRPLADVISDIVDAGYIPSFCTSCYRSGRVGKDFMDLAKPGLIKEFCSPNGLFTFQEYLNDFANSELQNKGAKLIKQLLSEIESKELREKTQGTLMRINKGARDLYL